MLSDKTPDHETHTRRALNRLTEKALYQVIANKVQGRLH